MIETINGQHIPVGTLEVFAQAMFSEPLEQVLQLKRLILAAEKFVTAGGKFYRLIWIGRGKAWLAGEDTKAYRTKAGCVASGLVLATEKGAHFSEVTR